MNQKKPISKTKIEKDEMYYLKRRLQMQQEPNVKYCIVCETPFESNTNILVASTCFECQEKNAVNFHFQNN